MRAKAALDKGDSLAAMEAYAKLAARKEQARPSDAEEEKPRVALLNETSFDRRRQVAVYKNDGKRGHHMQVRCPSTPRFSLKYVMLPGPCPGDGSHCACPHKQNKSRLL